MAALVGMFSKQAVDKLRELFDSLFRTGPGGGDELRADKLKPNQMVEKVMIPRSKIVAVVIPDGQTAQDVRILALHERLGGVVTRVPVFRADDSLLCVVHQSLIFKYLADAGIRAAKSDQPFATGTRTLADLLAAEGMQALVQDAVAWVARGTLLSDAKERMEATRGCQDVFVTEHGRPDEPVLGWLTDAELRRAAQV